MTLDEKVTQSNLMNEAERLHWESIGLDGSRRIWKTFSLWEKNSNVIAKLKSPRTSARDFIQVFV